MRTVDCDLSSLSYWIEDKGINEAFAEYYPNLAQSDPILREALASRKFHTAVIKLRTKQLEQQAVEQREREDDDKAQ